jgi:hypothetical protein
LIAVSIAYLLARLVSRPAGAAALLWWLGLAATGLAVVSSTRGLARRLRTLAVLLGVGATFEARPPSRRSIAWSTPDVLALHHRLESLASYDEAAGEARATRAALATALWAMERQPGSTRIAWHSGGRLLGARLAEVEFPGLFRVVPEPPSRQRAIAVASSAFAVSLLLASIVAGGVDDGQGGTQVAQPPSSVAPGSAIGSTSPPRTPSSVGRHETALTPAEALPPGPGVTSSGESASPSAPPPWTPGPVDVAAVATRSPSDASPGVEVASVATSLPTEPALLPSAVVGAGEGVVAAGEASPGVGDGTSATGPSGMLPATPPGGARSAALPAPVAPRTSTVSAVDSPSAGELPSTPGVGVDPGRAARGNATSSPLCDEVVSRETVGDRERPVATELWPTAAVSPRATGYSTEDPLAPSAASAGPQRDVSGAVPPTDRESIP